MIAKDFEFVGVPGVTELLPSLVGGLIARYFCPECENEPVVKDGQVAVAMPHDNCVALVDQQVAATHAYETPLTI